MLQELGGVVILRKSPRHALQLLAFERADIFLNAGASMMRRSRLRLPAMCSRTACSCDESGAYMPPPTHTSSGET